MRRLKATIISAFLLALCFSPVALAPAPAVPPSPPRPATGAGAMIDLLPESTVLAVEIREITDRWPEIRAMETISRFLDRLLTGSDLEPDDLPRLAGNEAIVALVPSANGRSLTPVALLRPPDIEEAEEILLRVASPLDADASLAVHRGRGALWAGPRSASDRLKQIADGDGTNARRSLVMDEIYRRLPTGGMVRGWVNPDALRTLLQREVEGIHPAPVEILRSFAAAEFAAIRFIGFRRELKREGVTTDGVIGFEESALPREVVRFLRSSPEDSILLPPPLPPGALLASSFRSDAEACLAWLRYVAASDPRGPLRNLDFWIEEFRARTGLDPEQDLVGVLGERGWFFLLEGDRSEIVRAVAILETRDPGQLEETLLELRAWLKKHIQGRTLGSVLPRLHDGSVDEWTSHGLTLWTPFAELPGPAFLVTDGHLVIGTGEPALRAGLELLEGKEIWTRAAEIDPASPAGAMDPAYDDQRASVEEGLRLGPRPALEHVRVDGPALSRWIEALMEQGIVGTRESGHVFPIAPAVADLLAGTGEISVDVWYERDAVRVQGRIRFNSD